MIDKKIKTLIEKCWNNEQYYTNKRGNTPHCNLSYNPFDSKEPIKIPCKYLNTKIKTCLGYKPIGTKKNQSYYFACNYQEENE